MTTATRTRSTFVAPTVEAQRKWDFDHGVWLAKTGHGSTACKNAEQLAGWNWYGEDCYLRCLAEQASDEAVL